MRLSLILSVVVSAVAATDTCASSADPQACTFRQTFLDLAQSDPSSTSSQPEALEPLPKPAVGYFMRNMTPGATARATIPNAPSWLQGHKIYRIAPGNFPDYMTYHYDGFAMPMRFDFGAAGAVSMMSKPYQSDAYNHLDECVFFLESGTGPFIHPKGKIEMCMTNPAVNPFPINGQLWLTIDTSWWGRVDPDTLETIPNQKVEVNSSVLTAHPACDHETGECFTNYPCHHLNGMWTDEICVGKFVTHADKNMSVEEVSSVKLKHKLFIHHSHEPCLSQNFLVVKLDSFTSKIPVLKNQGMLRYMNQKMDNLWLIFDRRTNASRILDSGAFKSINNHLLNCFERNNTIIVDTSPATDMYLDNYFARNLADDDRKWDTIMMPAQRCTIPTNPDATSFACETLLKNSSYNGVFDFPTFNPLWKANPDTRWWYATAPDDNNAKWFNTVIKGDAQERKVVAVWKEQGVYTTEANFIPRPGGTAEDDGVLFSVMYDSNIDDSILVLLDARNLTLIGKSPLGMVIPYHSHGVLCNAKGRCFANP